MTNTQPTQDPRQDALEEERRRLLAQLVRSADTIQQYETGYRMRVDQGQTDLIMQLVDAERECCQFLTFDIEFPAGLDTVNVTVTGPGGTREFLDQLVRG